MAMIECRSAQSGVESVMVEISGIADDQVKQAREILDNHLKEESSPSNAVAKSYVQSCRFAREPIRATYGSKSFTGTCWLLAGVITSGRGFRDLP